MLVLGDYVGIIKNHPGYRQLVLSDAVGKAERAMRGFPHGTAFDIEYEEPERKHRRNDNLLPETKKERSQTGRCSYVQQGIVR